MSDDLTAVRQAVGLSEERERALEDVMASDEPAFFEYLHEVLASHELSTMGTAVTNKVIAEGVASLTPVQRHAFGMGVVAKFVLLECSRCGGDISWSEMLNAYHNGGLCGWCDHMTDHR